MTTLYRPVLIESAEQAAALPVGTISLLDNGFEVCVKDSPDAWLGTHGPGAFTDESAVGMTALVPIEAEKEHKPDTAALQPWPERVPQQLPQLTRYVTPWERMDA